MIATDELKDYRESYARFLRAEVVPHYDEWKAAQIVPRSLFTQCAEYGFLAMEVPEEHGGPGVEDWRLNCVLAEESVRAGVGDAMAGPLLHSDVVLPYIMQSATEEQRARWLPGIASGETILAIAMTEPGTGSDLAGIQSRARREGDGYVLNGTKTFITNGITRTSSWWPRAQHASDTAELFFEDVWVPEDNRLGDEGRASCSSSAAWCRSG